MNTDATDEHGQDRSLKSFIRGDPSYPCPSVSHCLPSCPTHQARRRTQVITIRGTSNRREFLRVGGLGLAGLTLPHLLRREARAGENTRPKSVIYIVLGGGPSHIDSYDLKPDAPEEFRGPFK